MVVHAQRAAKKIGVAMIWSLALAFAGQAAAQTSFELAGAQFSGPALKADLVSARATTVGEFFAEPGTGYLTSVTLNGAVNQSETTDSYGLASKSVERRGNLSLNQSFDKLTTVGVSTGYIKSASLSRFDTLSVGQWWNKATVLTDVSATFSRSDRLSRDFMDTDGYVVRVAPRADGRTWRLGVTWLARPDFMVIGTASTTTSSDRPRANAETLEGRYFFVPTLTAIHISVDAYDDTAQVAKTTDYGRTSARTSHWTIHQHLSDQWIASLALRENRETETPRSIDTPVMHRHSREMRGKLRWRHVTGPVTDDVGEVYVFGGQYVSYDQTIVVRHIGLGGKYVL